jgi:outer membrane protein assembly factor BamB
MCSVNRLYTVSASDGHERWRFEVDKELTSPYSHHGMIFVGSEEGTLYALNSKTGSRNWTFNVAGPIFVAPGNWEDKIFSVSRDGTLFAIRADDGECIWHFTTSGKIYAPPYVSDGIIYLSSSDNNIYTLFAHSGRLICLKLKIQFEEYRATQVLKQYMDLKF